MMPPQNIPPNQQFFYPQGQGPYNQPNYFMPQNQFPQALPPTMSPIQPQYQQPFFSPNPIMNPTAPQSPQGTYYCTFMPAPSYQYPAMPGINNFQRTNGIDENEQDVKAMDIENNGRQLPFNPLFPSKKKCSHKFLSIKVLNKLIHNVLRSIYKSTSLSF